MKTRYYAGVDVDTATYDSLIRIGANGAFYLDKRTGLWVEHENSYRAAHDPTDFDAITEEKAAELAKKWGGSL